MMRRARLKRGQRVSEADVWSYLLQASRALDHLHKCVPSCWRLCGAALWKTVDDSSGLEHLHNPPLLAASRMSGT